MIYCVDHIGVDAYEVYGSIGFRRYECVSENEAIKKYRREAEKENVNGEHY